MKICVLSGSPKGEYSITLQTVLFLQSQFPECEFDILHVGRQIKSFEKDFSKAVDRMISCELLLFCYPVYTFMAPSQLHRFIELTKESGIDLSGKCAAQITTSKHFYDTTAHKYIEENLNDMGVTYLGGFSADMDDLLTKKGREDAIQFWKYILWKYAYKPCVQEKKKGYPVVVVADLRKEDKVLGQMIEDFCNIYPYETKVVNIREYPFTGGCLGCFNCAVTGKCVYKDGFDDFLRDEIQTNAAIVYAFTIKDHSMGSRFKMYDDRQFCNGHRTVTAGMPFGYLVNGDLAAEDNLKLIIEGRAQVGGNFLAGAAGTRDEIFVLAQTLEYALNHKLVLPSTFLGVGGMKIFRDMIYLMRGFMKADHKYYKKNKLYDFPQKKVGTVWKMKLLGGLITNPKVKAKMGNKMNEGMLAPYRKVLLDAQRGNAQDKQETGT